MNSRFASGNFAPSSHHEISNTHCMIHGATRYCRPTNPIAKSTANHKFAPDRTRYQSPTANTNPYNASRKSKDRVMNFIMTSRKFSDAHEPEAFNFAHSTTTYFPTIQYLNSNAPLLPLCGRATRFTPSLP